MPDANLMSEADKEFIRQSAIAGVKYSEVAKALGRSVNTINTAVWRMLKKDAVPRRKTRKGPAMVWKPITDISPRRTEDAYLLAHFRPDEDEPDYVVAGFWANVRPSFVQCASHQGWHTLDTPVLDKPASLAVRNVAGFIPNTQPFTPTHWMPIPKLER